jgi:hypothetical protein
MATTVTVLEAYISKDFYSRQGGGGSFSQQIIEGGGGTSNMAWLGNTASAVGTYGGESTIVAQETMVYQTSIAPYKLIVGAGVGGKVGFGNTGSYTYDIWAESSAMYFGYYNSTMATLNTTRWQFHEPIRIDDIAGGGDQLVTVDNDGDLGATRDIEVDSINFGDSASNITLDSSGKLTFTDEAGGPYELSELVGGGGGMVYPGAGIAVSTGSAWDTSITDNSSNWNTAYGWGDHASAGYADISGTPANNQIAVFTDANTIEGDSNFTWDGAVLTLASNVYITSDSAGNLVFGDNVSSAEQTLSDLIGGGGSSSSPLTTKGDIYTYTSLDARLPVGTDGQMLKADSAEATGLKWVDSPETGIAVSQATGNVSGVSFRNTENAISWTATGGIAGASVSISGSEITIDADGTYTFTVTLRTDSSARTELFIRTYIDTGGGFVQDTDAIVSDYVSRDNDQDTGSVTLVYTFVLNDGDVIEFRGFGDCDGTCVGLDAGTVLLCREEKGVKGDTGAAGPAGDVAVSGTPANNQLAIWTDASTIEGDSNVTWNGSTLAVTGGMNVSGTIVTATWQGAIIQDAYIANDITLTNITQITNRSHTNLSDIGSNTHAQIDTHLGATNNPHSVDETDVLPDQSGHSGEFLTTNGTVTSWSSAGGGMVYPGAGIAVSTGSAWDTSLTDNSSNWNTAYSHSQITTGNPHSIGYADISDFNTGVGTYETSHSDVVVDGDFSSNGILRRTGAGSYAALTGSSSVDTVETTLTDDDTHIPTSGAVYGAIAGAGGMVYPGAGIAVSTGSAWDTSITDNSSNWNTAYSHSQITTGNPHSIGYADIADFATGVANNETSHSDVVVDGDFSANGILRRTGAGTYASLTGSASVDTVETTLTDDDTHLPTSGAVYAAIAGAGGMVYPGAGIAVSTGSAWDTSITDNSSNWNTAYSHSQITTGNPHSIGYADITDFSTGVSTYETSHSTVVTASGISGYVPYFTGATTLGRDSYFQWDSTNNRLVIGRNTGSTVDSYVMLDTGTTDNKITTVNSGYFTTISHQNYYNASPNTGITTYYQRYGGTLAAPLAASTDQVIREDKHYVYQGSSNVEAVKEKRKVDGAVGSYVAGEILWEVKTGTLNNWTYLQMTKNGLEYEDDHSTAQASNDRWIPDKAYVDSAAGGVDTSGSPANNYIAHFTDADTITGDSGLTWSGTVLDTSGTLTVDTINEHTASAGVTIEGVVLEDTVVTFPAGTSYGIAFNNSGTSLITSSGLGQLSFYIGGALHAQFNGSAFATAVDFMPTSSKSFDLGGPSNYFDNAYVNRLYIDNASVYIDVSGTEMELTDSTGSYTLSDLAGGAGVWDENSAGEAVLAASAGHVLIDYDQEFRFGGSGTYITPSYPTSYMYFYANNNRHLSIGSSGIFAYYTILPSSGAPGDVNLGHGNFPFTELYVDDIYAAALPSGNRNETVQFNTSDGQFTYYDDTSDIRLKKDRKPITNASARIREWDIFSFRFNDLAKKEMNHDTKQVRLGMSAQSVQANTPEAVTTKDNGYLKLWYTDLIPVLAAGHNEHTGLIEKQQEKISNLEQELAAIKRHLNIN